MQTDKELLALAAKAACIQIGAYAEQIDSYCSEWDRQSAYELTTGGYWNPLIDDGDALRLAVLMELDVKYASVVSAEYGISVGIPAGVEKYAATRRAIVSAAAEIGKAMP